MNTPILSFVEEYCRKQGSRFHMPGHKGKSFLGCEAMDITEVQGADALYEAEGIIAQSEANASALFGSGMTLYSTEGSSQCIRAMLYLAGMQATQRGRPRIAAARNAHKAFVYGVALLDFDVVWLWPEEQDDSLCRCTVDPDRLAKLLDQAIDPITAVYLTSPNYLGGQADLATIAKVCHERNVLLLVDNAHGAYLRFLTPSKHPTDLGADLCCDSAHKTLPVLTGGAYLHLHPDAPSWMRQQAKAAMALFGSTSPSYLTLASLDACNRYLAQDYQKRLAATVTRLDQVRKTLTERGWRVEPSDPMRITLSMPDGLTGEDLADRLRAHQIECEYADNDYLVLMMTPENGEEDLTKLLTALGTNVYSNVLRTNRQILHPTRVCSLREALLCRQQTIPTRQALGRICASPNVSCPPAIPVAFPGERINQGVIERLLEYGITEITVMAE